MKAAGAGPGIKASSVLREDEVPTKPPPPNPVPRWQELLDAAIGDDGPEIQLEVSDDPNAAFAAPAVRRASNDHVPSASIRTPKIEGPPKTPSVRRVPIAPPPPRVPVIESDHDFPVQIAPILHGGSRSDAPGRPKVSPVPLPLASLAQDAHALVNRTSGFPPGGLSNDPSREMRERHALGDFTGALTIAETILQRDSNDADAQEVATDCRNRLRQMYIARIGGLALVPVMIVPRSELKWLSLHHRAGFLLSQIDGLLTVEELVEVAGMPEVEALRTLTELLSQHVIEMKSARGR